MTEESLALIEDDGKIPELTRAAGIECNIWEDGGSCFSCVCAVYNDRFGEDSAGQLTDDLEAEYIAAGVDRRNRQLLGKLVLYGARRRMLEALGKRRTT